MKYCISCGAEIPETNARADASRKYCARCAMESRRRAKAAWMREFRKTQREKNALTRRLCKSQAAEIAALKKIVQKQRDQLAALKTEIKGD